MEAAQDSSWILLAAGTLLVIGAIFGGGLEIKSIKIPQLKTPMRLIAAAVGIVFVTLGVWKSKPISGIQVPKTDFSITLLRPQSEETITSPVVLKGTVTGSVPEGFALWLVMKDEDDYYPQRRFIPSTGALWQETLEFGPAWNNRNATILIIKTDPKTDKTFQGLASEDESLKNLPTGVEVLISRTWRVVESS